MCVCVCVMICLIGGEQDKLILVQYEMNNCHFNYLFSLSSFVLFFFAVVNC